jgi:hypothetical protein
MKKTTNRGRKVSLDTKNQSNLREGRILCGCMAKDHRLINNCTACGKIACEQEGEGPCFFCGNPVFSPENLGRYEEEFKFQLQLESDPDLAESYYKAVDHKDKLLKWEENDVARKNVYDEDTDWYEVKQDVWATKEVRQHAIQKMAQIEEEEEIAKKVDIMNINFETGKIERQKVTVDHGAFKQDAVDFMKKANDVDPSKKKNEDTEKLERDYKMDAKLEEKEQQILAGVQQAYKSKIAAMEAEDSMGARKFFFLMEQRLRQATCRAIQSCLGQKKCSMTTAMTNFCRRLKPRQSLWRLTQRIMTNFHIN